MGEADVRVLLDSIDEVRRNIKDIKTGQDKVLDEFVEMDKRVQSVEQFRDNAARMFWIVVGAFITVGLPTIIVKVF
jgi:hypothetical protein